ncbi:exopolyphosphatase/guanosine-5'-triphosphate,3'-diphosphate pyrophosphatase [Sphingomonas zeicaulis]|uniref:Ppx/GppA phosphatase family protein n=1 Tax=Sphingomonas zeicaulis TaxID=1632740 RepID=UPI003D1BE694
MAVLDLFQRNQSAPVLDRSAIIDIGSNSVRLVVYDGPRRSPATLFNEKVLAGLGRGLSSNGALDREAMDSALVALARFRRLCVEMAVGNLRTVATAAVRDASNGPRFIQRIEALGLPVELLSGEQEAEAAGLGVISGIPDADGIVGDMGGGSLELVRVRGGAVHDRLSLPLGALRIAAIRAKGKRALDSFVRKALADVGWIADSQGLPFYLVGGSWRALARLDMHATDYPLPIVHHYEMDPTAAARLVRVLARIDKRKLKQITEISPGRIPTLLDSALLLAVLGRALGSRVLIASANGLREGLLYQNLSDEERAIDPLIAAAREEGVRQGRFREHGDLLARWIAPLFEGESAEQQRLRHAACLLADVGWRANPDFRAERGVETALHGNWVGIDAFGRAMVAQALCANFGGGSTAMNSLFSICPEAELKRALRWGLAMRLGQRLSGGVAGPLESSRVEVGEGALRLFLTAEDAPLYGEAVERRHRQLAGLMGLTPVLMG